MAESPANLAAVCPELVESDEETHSRAVAIDLELADVGGVMTIEAADDATLRRLLDRFTREIARDPDAILGPLLVARASLSSLH